MSESVFFGRKIRAGLSGLRTGVIRATPGRSQLVVAADPIGSFHALSKLQ